MMFYSYFQMKECPIHLAARLGSWRSIRHLLTAGVDIDIPYKVPYSNKKTKKRPILKTKKKNPNENPPPPPPQKKKFKCCRLGLIEVVESTSYRPRPSHTSNAFRNTIKIYFT